VSVKASMIASAPNQRTEGITAMPSTQIHQIAPVNLTSEP
jgi:hypothetical protein